jgi:hypothetical protein
MNHSSQMEEQQSDEDDEAKDEGEVQPVKQPTQLMKGAVAG